MNVRKKDLTSALFIRRKDVVGSRHRAWENKWSVQAPVLEFNGLVPFKVTVFPDSNQTYASLYPINLTPRDAT